VSENKEDHEARLVRDTWVIMAATTIETRLWSARAFVLRGKERRASRVISSSFS
jgi:hypothetical protein